MRGVRRKAAGVALAGLAAAGVAIGAPGTHFASERARVATGGSCAVATNTIGHVTVVARPKIWHNGKQRYNNSGFSLQRKDWLRTAKRGEINFCLTEGTTLCRAHPGVKVRVKPSDDVVARVVRGEAQCSTSSGGTKEYDAGDTVVKVGDPVFSVKVTKTATIVKVFLGAAEVRGDSGHANPVVAIAGSQTSARRGGGAAKPVPITLSKRERKIFNKLAQALPKRALKTKPTSEGSQALRTIFDRGVLLVEIEPNANADPGVQAFTQDFLGFLARSWGLKLDTRPPGFARDVAPRLAAGKADLFVTWAPEEVTTAGIRGKLGDKAGVAAVPFVVSGRNLFYLATPADAGLVWALRRFLTAAALQTREYGSRFVKAFKQPPPYGRLGDLAFPSAAHATGTATVVHHSFQAVVNGQLGPGLTVTKTAKGTCAEPSLASARPDAWRCIDGSTETTWDPCFSGIPRVVVCPSEPPTTKQPTRVVKLSLVKPLPAGGHPKSEPTAGLPRLIRISGAGGATCEPSPGTTQAFGSQPLNYVCRPSPGATKIGYLAGAPFRAATPWVMLFVPPSLDAAVADTTGLAEAWFW